MGSTLPSASLAESLAGTAAFRVGKKLSSQGPLFKQVAVYAPAVGIVGEVPEVG
jgi:hypothetical protein